MASDVAQGFDLDRYLDRIGLAHVPPVTPDGLTQVIQAQLRNISFENLDVMMGRSPGLSAEALTDKLISRKRGGYCFELNSLLALGLNAMGFQLRPLLARVRFGRGPDEPTPKTHQLLLVHVDDRPYVADAGFGMGLPCAAMPLGEEEHNQLGTDVRLQRVDEGWMAQASQGDRWIDLYYFDLTTVYPIDIVAANHFTATFPQSPFRTSAMLGRLTEDGRLSVVRGQGTLFTARGPMPVELPSDGRVAWLREQFGIHFNGSDQELPPWVATPP